MRFFIRAAFVVGLVACQRTPTTAPTPVDQPLDHAVIPIPSAITITRTDSFLVTPRTVVYVDANASAEVEAIGTFAADVIASRVGATAQRLAGGATAPDSSISLSLDPSRTQLGAEGYELTSTRTSVRIVAAQPAGLFYGVQTMRQLFPPAIEHQGGMNQNLRSHAGVALETVGIAVTCEQHQLKKQHGGGPHGGSPSEEWQDHLPDHGLKTEEQKRAEQQSRGQKQSQVERHTQHAASLTACRKLCFGGRSGLQRNGLSGNDADR